MLSGQSVLFISPRFFGYEREIARGLEEAGASVDWYNHIPTSRAIVKALIRISPGLATPLSNKYFYGLLGQIRKKKYHWVFVIKGESLTKGRLQTLRECQGDSQFVYYSWDSLKNFKNSEEKLNYFDKAFSFDRADCSLNPKIKHLPLFYIRPFEEIGQSATHIPEEDIIDMLFLGSIHSDRYSVVGKIFSSARRKNPNIKVYSSFYYQSKWIFGLLKLVDGNSRRIPWSEVRWIALDSESMLALVRRAKILIDVHHQGQTGLTMRTIESLGAKRKLITTNPDIKNYNFYDSANIEVVDRDNPVLDLGFLVSRYKEVPEDIYNSYSLKSWLNKIFE